MGDYHGFYVLLPKDNFSRAIQKISELPVAKCRAVIVQKDSDDGRKGLYIRESNDIFDLPFIITEYAQDFVFSHQYFFISSLEFEYAGKYYYMNFDCHSDFALSVKDHWVARLELPWDNKFGRKFFIPIALERRFMVLIDFLAPNFGFAKVDYSFPFERIKIPNFDQDSQLFDFCMRYRCADKEGDAKTFALPLIDLPFESLSHSRVITVGQTRFICDVSGFGNNFQSQQPVDEEFEIPYDKFGKMIDALRHQSKIAGEEIVLSLDIIEGTR